MNKKSSNPTVSILLPVYNGQAYLQEMLESIASQNLTDFELIVVDDGSTDGSWDLLTSWMSSHTLSVRRLRKPVNLGVCAALVDASRLARGRYIAQIGQDDVWSPDHLSELCAALDNNPDASAAFAGVTYIDAQSKPMVATVFNHGRIDEDGYETLLAKLTAGNFLCAPASMFRRDFFDISYWGASNERLQDYELWLNLLLHGRFVFTKQITCSYRLHNNNLSSGSQMRLQSEYELLMTLMRVLMSGRFEHFYAGLNNDSDRRIEFVRALDHSLTTVTAYCSGIALLHAAVLERISMWETERLQEVNAMRIKTVRALGLLRKALALRKVSSAHLLQDNSGVPYLVPAHDSMSPLVTALIEEGCFQDGAHIDFSSVDLPYLYACSETQVEQLKSYDSFLSATHEHRVVVFDTEKTGDHPCGFGIAADQHLDHGLMDKLFKFMEEKHRSFYQARPMIG
ncbi:glycosyltransferase [Burkholderia sp. D-99]|uniref:glycosyltransferase family 2 protein n=1 Tax=Burkholderia sp. D-99 TaxID=2717316 RepID=UPI0014244950|nr:glycosyltransferase [Burkholderia sp. D-99]NHV27416.1 glycosyltransferase [Burkholderia sp. D-99]